MSLTIGDETEEYSSLDCGCREKIAQVGMAEVVMHLEPNGFGESFICMGEWEEEKLFPDCKSIEELEIKIANYINNLPTEGKKEEKKGKNLFQ